MAIDVLTSEGIPVTWRTVSKLARFDRSNFIPSDQLAEFVSSSAGIEAGARVLDPWAGAAVLLAAAAERTSGDLCVGTVQQEQMALVARRLVPDAALTVGDPMEELARLARSGTTFEAVVCAPRWGGAKARATPDGHSEKPSTRLSLADEVILGSCALLSETGRAAFLLPDAFLLSQGRAVRGVLASRGFHLWSAVAVPPSWTPGYSLTANVVEIRASRPEQVLIGRATADSDNAGLLANLAAHASGRSPELGSLVASDTLTTWADHERGLAFQTAARKFGGDVVQLVNVVAEQHLGDRSHNGGFQDLPNAVFLPLLGASRAVTTRLALAIKPRNYVQLVLDPEAADADYLAFYLNSPIGMLSRETIYPGAYIRKASLRTIGSAPIVLPAIGAQLNMVALQRRIHELGSELHSAERDLWGSQGGARVASAALRRFPEDGGLDTWLGRLPYPLASILWNYQATLEPRRKIEILFAFFEATAEFLSTILLSGLRSNSSVYEELRVGGLREIESVRWRDATLGFWIVTGGNLAKTVRRMLSGPERDTCLDLFRCSGAWLEAMVSKELLAALGRAHELRNAWKGHGGIETDVEMQQRLARLQAELASLLGPLTQAFNELSLVRPHTLRYDGQLFDVVAEDLVGAAVPFREKVVQTVVPMRAGELYVLEQDARQGLELLPFVRMRAGTPAATACYFYNRLRKEGARFVSYHQAQESEVTEQDHSLAALVDELTGDGR